MTCPHLDALRPRGDCYYDLKLKAGLFGERSYAGTLSADEAGFVRLLGDPRSSGGWSTPLASEYPPTDLERRRDLLRGERQQLRVLISERTARRIAAGGSR